jgi:hypothetical protein
MKNKNLKICLVLILLFAVHSIKAQSFQKKPDPNKEPRRKYLETMLLKAKEQQTQQQAEKRNEPDVNVSQQGVAPNSTQSDIQTNGAIQKTNADKPAVIPTNKKPVPVQQPKINGPVKKE